MRNTQGTFTLTPELLIIPQRKGGLDLGRRNGMKTLQENVRALGNSSDPEHRFHIQKWKREMQLFKGLSYISSSKAFSRASIVVLAQWVQFLPLSHK